MNGAQWIYLLLLLFNIVLGLIRWKVLRKPERIIVILIALTILQETVADLAYSYLHNNLFTYHVYSPIEFFLLCLYFNHTNALLRRWNGGLAIGTAGLIVSALNSLLLQPPLTTFNSYYVLFEATTIIILCLLSLYDILLDDSIDFRKKSYFWFTLALLFYWSFTYTGWGVFNLIHDITNRPLRRAVELTVSSANLVFYIGLIFIFINYKKLNHSGQ